MKYTDSIFCGKYKDPRNPTLKYKSKSFSVGEPILLQDINTVVMGAAPAVKSKVLQQSILRQTL